MAGAVAELQLELGADELASRVYFTLDPSIDVQRFSFAGM